MGGGGPIGPIGAAGRAAEYHGRLTGAVIFVAIIAASGGLLFGYDLGERLGWAGLESWGHK